MTTEAALAQLRAEHDVALELIGRMRERITVLDSAVIQLQAENADLKVEVHNLNAQISHCEEYITELKGVDVESYHGKGDC